jgi:hypothetical protein
MAQLSNLYKNNPTDVIEWVDNDMIGEFEFTFDHGQTIFNLFADYPFKLSPEQKALFDKENPYWADFFKARTA